MELFALTDMGLRRSNNEDAVLIDEALGYLVLADGMGGYSTGEIASALTIEALRTGLAQSLPNLRGLPPDQQLAAAEEDLTFAISRANHAVFNQSQVEGETMGSTVVAAVILERQMVVAHVGDSRMYRFRSGQLSAITKDHSWLQEQIDLGSITPEDASQSRYKNLVTRGIGIEETVDVEVQRIQIEDADVFLVCSDGLSDMATHDEMVALLHMHINEPLEQIAQGLINLANEKGGRDNVSVILARGAPEATGSSGKDWLRAIGQMLRK